MALKKKISKADFEKLDEAVQGLYTLKGTSYILDVEDDESEIKDALEKERRDHKEAKRKLQEVEDAKKAAEEAAEEAKRQAAEKNGDVDAINKSWQAKLDKQKETYENQISTLNSSIESLTVGSTSTSLAAELAVEGAAGVIEPHIKSRLKTEFRDGKAVVTVLDKEGKPSAMSVDELKEEFINNPSFARVINGSKASGAGALPGNKGGGAVPKGKLDGTPEERAEYFRTKYPDLNKVEE